MATLQGKAVKNTYRQVLQIGANNVGVSGTLQPVQDGAGVNTALSLSTLAATVNGDLTITGDLIITGGGLQIKDLIDDTVAALIQNGTGITWTYNDGAATLTGNFTGTTSVVPEGSNLYYTQGRFDSAFAAKSTTNLAEGTNLYFTEARGNANFATNLAASDTNDLAEGSTNLYYTNARARTALSVTAGTGLSYDNTTGVFNLAAIPNASLTNSSITINGQAVSLGGTVTLTTTNIAEGTNLYWTTARGNANFATNLAASTTTNLAEGTNLYYTQARFDTAFSNKSTTNLAEGTNLYYTQTRFNNALAAKTTTDLAEGTNLYYTDARARLALSSSATGLSYANNSGVFSLTAGYAIPTTVKLGEYDIAYNRSIVSAAVTGTSTKTLSLTQQDANVITATWTDQGITTINGTANQIAATTVGNTTTLAFTNDVTMPNNLVVSGNLTINGTATYVNTESISSKDPLFEVANTNNTTDAVDIGYYGRYYDSVQERVEFTGLFRDASDAGKFKIFTGLVDEPTNVVNTTGTGYTVATLVANVDGNLNGTANAANILSTARTIAASGDATWSVSFNGSANVSSALTLANTGVTATTYGTSTAVPTIAVDSKGRITSASNTNITFPVTTVNGFAGTVVLTTSDVAEGTNQYFTTARAQAAITGGASSVVTANLTASRALVSDGSGKIAASATTTTTEIGYLAGVTSAIQTQLNGKLNLTGGTLTGGLIGTTGSFSSGGSGDTFTIGHTSGSGIALNITKNGNGEGLYINKASGSGNAATFVGNLGGTTASFSGLLSGTSATFSSTLGVTGALTGTSATFSGNVGIGAAPNYNLEVSSSSAGFSEVAISNTNAVGAPRLSLRNAERSFILTSNPTDDLLSFAYNNENRLQFDLTNQWFNSGNLGVNTNNPDFGSYGSGERILGISNTSARARLQLQNTATGTSGVSGTLAFFNASTLLTSIDVIADGATNKGRFVFNTNDGTTFGERLRITNAGNIGIGTTPSAWGTVFTKSVIQFGGSAGVGALWTNSFNNGVFLGNNGYDDGAGNNRYILNGTATEYVQSGGEHYWRSAASGTSGNTITYNEIMRLGSNLNVGIGGTAGANAKLHVFGSTAIGATASGGDIRLYVSGSTGSQTPGLFNNTNGGSGSETIVIFQRANTTVGSITSTNSLTSYNVTSDYRLKEDLKEINGLSKVCQIKVYDFKWIKSEDRMDGVIAHELQEVLPYAVHGEKDAEEMQSVDYSKLVPILVKAIQELKAEIDELKAK
jgi:hypothetical protein